MAVMLSVKGEINMLGSVEERILNVIDNVKDIFSGAQ